MKTVYLLVALTISMASKAQIEKVSLQASGLTCSMCSNSINKALKTLAFVERVDADVKNYSFEIYFRDNNAVDFNQIRKRVEAAGFSVSGFTVSIRFNQVYLQNANEVLIGKNTVIITNAKDPSLNGLTRITILDKGFVSAKNSKRTPFAPLTEAVYHGTI